jgi:hypothetical protein
VILILRLAIANEKALSKRGRDAADEDKVKNAR